MNDENTTEPGFEGLEPEITYGTITRPNGTDLLDVTLTTNDYIVAFDADETAVSITAKTIDGAETVLGFKPNVFWTLVSLLGGISVDDLADVEDVPNIPIRREDITITQEQLDSIRAAAEFDNLIRSINFN